MVIETTDLLGPTLLQSGFDSTATLDGSIRSRVPSRIPPLLQSVIGSSKSGQGRDSDCELHDDYS